MAKSGLLPWVILFAWFGHGNMVGKTLSGSNSSLVFDCWTLAWSVLGSRPSPAGALCATLTPAHPAADLDPSKTRLRLKTLPTEKGWDYERNNEPIHIDFWGMDGSFFR